VLDNRLSIGYTIDMAIMPVGVLTMTAKQKLKTITDCLNAIGDHNGIYKTITKTEAITFIRELMFVANSTSQGQELSKRFEFSTSQLDWTLTEREQNHVSILIVLRLRCCRFHRSAICFG